MAGVPLIRQGKPSDGATAKAQAAAAAAAREAEKAKGGR